MRTYSVDAASYYPLTTISDANCAKADHEAHDDTGSSDI